jgi:hypothetical protein
MSVMILNIPNVYAEEDWQMPSAEWLDIVKMRGERNTHGNTSTDGHRLHFDKSGLGCNCGADKCNKANALAQQAEKEATYLFSVSRQYLLDALSGIESVDGEVHLFKMDIGKVRHKDSVLDHTNVLILSNGENRMAVIMPLAVVPPNVLAAPQGAE